MRSNCKSFAVESTVQFEQSKLCNGPNLGSSANSEISDLLWRLRKFRSRINPQHRNFRGLNPPDCTVNYGLKLTEAYPVSD